MFIVPAVAISSSEAHRLFRAMFPRSACAMESKSLRTPVRPMAWVGDVPASLLGICFK